MTANLRAMTSDERAFLLEQKQFITNISQSRLEVLMIFTWIWFSSAAILYLIYLGSLAILKSLGAPFWLNHILDQSQPYAVPAISFVFAFHGIILHEWKGKHRRAETLSAIDEDLANGAVMEDSFIVEDAICLIEQEHLMRIYLLKTTDGRIRVRYDYDSADVDGRGKSRRTKFAIAKEVRLVSFPLSKQSLYHDGPTRMRKPRASDLMLGPKYWPEHETWLEMEWSDVKSHYAAQSA